MTSPIFQRSVDTDLLVKQGRDIAIGDVWTYDSMEALLGRSCRSGERAFSSLLSARRILLREDGIAFDPIVNVGLRRLTDEEKARHGAKSIRSIHRKAGRGMAVVASAEYEGLTEQGRVAFNTNLSILGMLQKATEARAVKKIEAATADASNKLSIANTMKSLLNGKE